MELNISAMGSHRHTLIYRVSHCVSVDWKPSHTLIAKAIGPSMDSTIRKNVRMVSMTSADAWKRTSSSSRNQSRMLFFKSYIPRSMYIPDMATKSDGDHPNSSSFLSNSSSLTM